MDGHVKWFSNDKGYGFIHAQGHGDYFFHVSQVQGAELPNNGDSVTFTPSIGKNSKPAATKVVLISKEPASYRNKKPYYGKATYKKGDSVISPWLAAPLGGSIMGLVSYYEQDNGLFISIVVAIVSAVIYGKLAQWIKKDAATNRKEITSTCMKCGGTAQVTARDNGYIGFQCPKCKSFWKKRDNLPK